MHIFKKLKNFKMDPFSISILYFIFGFLWIFFSDKILLKISPTHNFYTELQTYKVWIYVVITTILIYLLLKIYAKQKNKLLKDLKAKQNLYEATFENTGNATVVLDKNGTIIHANKKAASFAGLSRSKIEGKKEYTEFIVEKDRARIKRFHAAQRRDNNSVPGPFEFKAINSNGKQRKMLATIGLISGSKKTIASLIDITELESIKQALNREQNLRARLTEASPVGFILFDKNGKIVFANQKTSQLLDQKQDELLNSLYTELDWQHFELEKTHPKKPISPFLKVKNSKEPIYDIKKKICRSVGETLFLSINATPLFDHNNNFEGVLVTIQDITQRIQLKKQFEQSQKLEAIGQLAGGIAHDFNNMITVITGQAQIATMDINKSNPLHYNLNEIINAAERAAKLTNQLLLFSQNRPVNVHAVNINKIIKKMASMLERLIGENINIHFDLESNLWTIEGDDGNIEQVIMNLVINARDAMPDGGDIFIKTGNITISEDETKSTYHSKQGKHVVLTVKDTGTGMDPDTINHIFEPFFTTKQKDKGTGLGLSVIYGIVNNHGGWINVDSQPGEGTTFKIYLPFSSKLDQKNESKRSSIKHFKGQGEKILFVEDEPGILEYGKQLLEQNGYKVDGAKNATEAYQKFHKKQGEYDLVICDVVLPDISGIELVEDLQKKQQDLAVIMSSGYTEEKSKQTKITDKGLPFIQKPYQAQDLLNIMRETLNNRQAP
ncbi:MAG: PAS domain S-box protein [Candidatus Marinimicrobia bacterium]|nr:PAS domain S-box protein [Candidatus Neomarinimicrobiota bacterium]